LKAQSGNIVKALGDVENMDEIV